MDKITLITPCSRPENIKQVFESINFPCEWRIVFDATDEEFKIIKESLEFLIDYKWVHLSNIKGGVSGNLQRNKAMDEAEKGWWYFLDDDNKIHPDFYDNAGSLIYYHPDIKCFFFSQEVNRKVKIRNVSPETVKVNKIDQAQFIIHSDLIGAKRYVQKYEADGIFIQQIFAHNPPELFYFFNTKVVTYYNRIEYEKNRNT